LKNKLARHSGRSSTFLSDVMHFRGEKPATVGGICALGLILVLSHFLSCALGKGYLAVAGLFLSVVALLVTLTILGWTRKNAEHSDAELAKANAAIERLPGLFEGIPESATKAEQGIADGDIEPKTMPVAEEEGLGLFTPEQIPLRVLGDLGTKTDLRARRVRGAARGEGRGNYPWLIGLDDGSLWRVAYGGKAKVGPTVTKV
jgi:hypothetical protein